jgi:cytochrome c553
MHQITRSLAGRVFIALALSLGSAFVVGQTQTDPATVPKFQKLDSIEARVQGCVTCHGQQGQGTLSDYFPRIAGKPAGYLLNQLRAFRDGTRRYAPMNYLVAFMSDEYLREIAEYFASLRPPFPTPQPTAVPAALLDHARSLVANGDANRQIPPCRACHGAKLTGMVPGIPGLAGLRPNYIAAQLTRWRTGERRAAAPDCMRRVASRLQDADIRALAAYLGSVPAPDDASPEPRNTVRMPLSCGSQR